MRKPQLPLFKRLWRNSQTKFLAYTQAISGTVLVGATQLHDAIVSPTINDALDKLNLPWWFPYMVLTLAGLTYLAHGHNEDA